MAVAVRIAGHADRPGVETTFTENVSPRGARVLTSRRWKRDTSLTLDSLSGEFRAEARVAYCQAVPGEGFAIGVQFIKPQGRWVLGRENGLAAS
jgi:hypothetical protein